jgi:hypothetical protein
VQTVITEADEILLVILKVAYFLIGDKCQWDDQRFEQAYRGEALENELRFSNDWFS